MTPPDPCAISVVLPVFNEAEILPELYRRVKSVLVSTGLSHEIIFVNDGSRDQSWAAILELSNVDRQVKAVNLSRNFGHQIAITAGIDVSAGDAVVVMDSDLQDPPELIPEMWARHREGFDVVYAQRRTRQGESWFKRATAAAFYRLIRRMSTIDVPLDTGDFRLMSRRVVEDLKRLGEQSRFVRGLVTWVGYNQTALLYDRDRRFGGETKYPLSRMLKFALDGITGFSSQPLRLASHLGLFFAAASMVLTIALIVYRLAGGPNLIPGWTSIVVAVLFLGGLQLVAIGILGEYVGRIHEESKRRPLYLIKDAENLGQVTPRRRD